jgi:hypothetical protein
VTGSIWPESIYRVWLCIGGGNVGSSFELDVLDIGIGGRKLRGCGRIRWRTFRGGRGSLTRLALDFYG